MMAVVLCVLNNILGFQGLGNFKIVDVPHSSGGFLISIFVLIVMCGNDGSHGESLRSQEDCKYTYVEMVYWTLEWG